MPENSRAYPASPDEPGILASSRHRVDRRDELVEDVPAERRWATVEIRRLTETDSEVLVECGDEQVQFDPSVGVPVDAPKWAERVLEHLGVDVDEERVEN
jgi:hypothetical protein